MEIKQAFYRFKLGPILGLLIHSVGSSLSRILVAAGQIPPIKDRKVQNKGHVDLDEIVFAILITHQ